MQNFDDRAAMDKTSPQSQRQRPFGLEKQKPFRISHRSADGKYRRQGNCGVDTLSALLSPSTENRGLQKQMTEATKELFEELKRVRVVDYSKLDGNDEIQAAIDAVEELFLLKENSQELEKEEAFYEEAPLKHREEPSESRNSQVRANVGLSSFFNGPASRKDGRGRSRDARVDRQQDSQASDEQSLPSLVSYDLTSSVDGLSKSDSLSGSYDGLTMVSSCSTLMRSLREMIMHLDGLDSEGEDDTSVDTYQDYDIFDEKCDCERLDFQKPIKFNPARPTTTNAKLPVLSPRPILKKDEQQQSITLRTRNRRSIPALLESLSNHTTL